MTAPLRPALYLRVSTARQAEPIYRSSAGRWRKHAAELKPLLAALDGAKG